MQKKVIVHHVILTLIVLILMLLLTSIRIFAENRDQRQQPEKVMDVIGVGKGMSIGIAGAGRGYFTFKMALRVGSDGRIYANEIKSYLVDHIKNRCKTEGIANVTAILGEVADPLFPKGQMDMVFMCYVFHDLEKPVAFLNNIKKSLKPGASVVLLEQDPDKTGSDHFFSQKALRKKVEAAGYKITKMFSFLTKDNIYICHPLSKNHEK